MAPIAAKEGSLTSTFKLGYLRHMVQAQILIMTVYGLAVASFPIHVLWRVDPLLGASAALAGQLLPVRFLIAGLAMLLASMVLGRAFCGWICPLGFAQDLVYPIRELARRLGRGPGICDYGARPSGPPHLMICRGKDVIGHVIWGGAGIDDAGRRLSEDGRREVLAMLPDDRKGYLELREIWLRSEYRGRDYELKILRLFEDFARGRGHAAIVAMPRDGATVSLLRNAGYEEVALAGSDRALFSSLGGRLSIPEGLRYIKYALLLGGLIMAAVAGWTILEWLNPLSVVARALSPIHGQRRGLLLGIAAFTAAILLTALTGRRAWCRYVCPLGAVLSLPSARKLVGIKLNERRCIRCLRCEGSCTMGIIDVEGQSGLRWDSECIACLKCRDVCPADAIGLEWRK